MSERARKLLKWVGYPVFGLFCFLVFLYLSFPFGKLKDRIEAQIAASGEMEVTIGELGPSPIVGISAENVVVVLKPKPGAEATGEGGKGKAKGQRISLDQVVVKPGLMTLFGSTLDVSFTVTGLGGEIDGSYSSRKKEGWSASIEVNKIELSRIPLIAESMGLPAAGSLSSKIELDVPGNRWSAASGQIEIECDGCSVGDGKAKLKIPGNVFLAQGVTLPQLRLGKLGGQIKIEKGVATIENVSAQSPDLEMALEGNLRLSNPLPYSSAQAYLRFKISPDLKRKNATFELLENSLSNAKRGDGFFGMQIMGSLGSLRFVPSSIGPGPADRAAGRRPRS